MARCSTVASPLDEVLETFQALLDARGEAPVPAEAGRGNFRCERCEDCSYCRFCSDCTACEDCTYCEGCEGCSGCTHCKHCNRCKQTTHSSWSSECVESSYLTLCLDCETCVQCFACVGLQNEEFCVLNEKLPRKAYFSRVAALRAALEERVAAGWRPPWAPALSDDEPDDEHDEPDEPEHDEPEPPNDEFERRAAPAEPDLEPEPEPEPEPVRRRANTPRPVPEARPPSRSESSWSSERTPATPEPEPSWPGSLEQHTRDLERGPEPSPRVGRSSRTEVTVDIQTAQTRQGSREDPRWALHDARRDRSPAPSEDEPRAIPEPPPFGSGPHLAAEPVEREAGAAERERPAESPRDRYGWSAQVEGTPARLGWSARAEGGPERQRWSDDDEHLSWPVPEPRTGRWSSEGSSGRWQALDHEDLADRTRRTAWDSRDRRSSWDARDRRSVPRDEGDERPRRPTPWISQGDEQRPRRSTWDSQDGRSGAYEHTDDVRRRQETAAAPRARGVDLDGLPDPRQLEAWSPYEEAHRTRLGPDDQTEPDAPVARRSPARPEISGAALASGEDEEVMAMRRSETRATRRANESENEVRAELPARSLSAARRPERPAAPQPPERSAGLLRGRAPARPTAPTPPARQADAPSLRRARRPTRSRDETPTSEYEAFKGRNFDPERS
ncbi:tumor necrosis factor receptor family protein [Paraliomyxa miuraensis]|uniref:hypothetical protein n=1 Tax=Paraliomyxa miuraensis TaxID=376150 RepID=UPI002257CEBA|nr:hypothetical protein [Paraliomyxa miuraensis]MCX4244164.1 hypothetical protein [Paraliomyxa miuraensis]